MSESDYMVIDERTGKVLVSGVNLDKARLVSKEDPWNYRIMWQKALVAVPQRKGQ